MSRQTIASNMVEGTTSCTKSAEEPGIYRSRVQALVP